MTPPAEPDTEHDDGAGDTIRAVRITPDGVLDVVHIRPRYDALADAAGVACKVGDIGIVSVGTWKMTGVGYLTLWTGGDGPRNELAERVAARIMSRAAGSIDRIWDRIAKGALAGTVVLAAYDRDTGGPADVGDVAVERVREVADGRLAQRTAAAQRAAETTAIDMPPTTTLPAQLALTAKPAQPPQDPPQPAGNGQPVGGVADLVKKIAPRPLGRTPRRPNAGGADRS